MIAWIKSLRLPVCLLAGLLTIVSFKISGLTNKPWLPALTVVIIASATMVYNDWRDRFHDVKKNKTLALRHPKAFQIFTIGLWGIAIILTVFLWNQDSRLGILPCFAILVGLIYPELRKIPLASVITVSITSASVALFPVFIGHASFAVWLLFGGAVIIIFVREVIKDLQDRDIDYGYKWTLPLTIQCLRLTNSSLRTIKLMLDAGIAIVLAMLFFTN